MKYYNTNVAGDIFLLQKVDTNVCELFAHYL